MVTVLVDMYCVHCTCTDLSLPLGKTSTLHMIVRERLPNENQPGEGVCVVLVGQCC